MIIVIALAMLAMLGYVAWEIHIARRNARQRKRHAAEILWRMYRR